MKTLLTLGLALLALQSVCPGRSSIDVLVVAEQTVPGARLAPPTLEHPAYYVAYDAGYIEAGAPIAGLTPPAAIAINRALRTALRSADYEAAPVQMVPSLVLIYHWGSIRREFLNGLFNGGNLEARLSLVAPWKMVLRAEEFLADRREADGGYVASDLRSTLELAAGAHYFVIVSAYDFADLTRHTTTLLWRVRLSAQENSGSMEEVLPALIGICGPYLGRNFDSRQSISAPLPLLVDRENADASPPTPDPTGRIDAGLIRNLMKREHDLFSGERGAAVQKNQPAMPPALVQHINAYREEKAALQAILAEKIGPRPPGPETRRAIDAFNSEYSGRIAALARMRESIRGELAQLGTVNSTPADGQPLDALLREFAIDIRQLEHPAAGAN